ncbi:hypothetical protein FIBSPDRAFT_235219 [Athelia psychrophila]|uniref:MYND-type domain-containing protein n=1 Tax=Athelia psychrophila TaxID=1759441 RepID=A0A166RZV5_9AGAM|nr:hypothetical protein FIBSPDRAFT_235219 [Fibularhizoctonia sp. CBS 109695]
MRTSSRPAIDIERAAKIGISLGALHPVCEGSAECKKMAGSEVQKLLHCSRCQMVRKMVFAIVWRILDVEPHLSQTYYCSALCQRAAWPKHKKVCGKPGQREQALPSQEKLDNFVWTQLARVDEAMKKFQEMRAAGVEFFYSVELD